MKFLPLAITASTLVTTSFCIPESLPSDPEPRQEQPVDTKYFHEPGGGDVLGHYDVRYFQGHTVTYEEKQDTLRHLIRSYLSTFRTLNIETWIAHGTLLGWWWNGKIMPWDWDLDTQVSASTLYWLGENLNMTMHNYTMKADDGTEEVREYLLDINPNVVERVRGDGQNVIDARWIDVRNGLFIDITGLAETEPSALPGVWSCKNYHRYRTRELYPLRETNFEGAPALVPFSFDKILTEEYSPQALTNTLHEGHQWVPDQKAWIKMPETETDTKRRRRDPNSATPRSSMNAGVDKKAKPGLRNLSKVL